MNDKLLTPEELMQSAINHLQEPSFRAMFRDVKLPERGVVLPTYRPMTPEEAKARYEANIQREARNKALVDQAFAKLTEEEIEAIEAHFSEVFY